jgi:hypothetical protein
MTVSGSHYDLYSGFDVNFFEKRLQISIDADDILNTNDSWWEDRYGNVVSGMNRDADNRVIRFSIKYNFNHFKGGAKNKSASEDELKRL